MTPTKPQRPEVDPFKPQNWGKEYCLLCDYADALESYTLALEEKVGKMKGALQFIYHQDTEGFSITAIHRKCLEALTIPTRPLEAPDQLEQKTRGLLKSIDGWFVDHAENCEIHKVLKEFLYGDKAVNEGCERCAGTGFDPNPKYHGGLCKICNGIGVKS